MGYYCPQTLPLGLFFLYFGAKYFVVVYILYVKNKKGNCIFSWPKT